MKVIMISGQRKWVDGEKNHRLSVSDAESSSDEGKCHIDAFYIRRSASLSTSCERDFSKVCIQAES